MQKIKCFKVSVWDGGSRHDDCFYLSDEAQALAHKSENPCDLVEPVEIVIFDTLAEREEAEREEDRRDALSKLSKTEQAALGIAE